MVVLAGVALAFLLGLAGPGVEARKVAPLIEDEWARRPHRAAGESLINELIFIH